MQPQIQSRRYSALPFSPDYTFVSCREQVIAGHRLAAGQTLPDDIPQRVVRSLYETRRIAPAAPTVPKDLKEGDQFFIPGVGTVQLIKAAAVQSPVPRLVSAEGAEPAPQAETAPETPAQQGVHAKHAGFGKWILVRSDGTRLDGEDGGPFGKAEAEARAEAHNANLQRKD